MRLQLNGRLRYICLGLFLGYAIFSVGSMNRGIIAQDEPKVVDELTVRDLRVLNKITVGNDKDDPLIIIGKDLLSDDGQIIVSGETGGSVSIMDKREGSGSVMIRVGTDGDGGITIRGKEKKGAISLYPINGKGAIYVEDQYGRRRNLAD